MKTEFISIINPDFPDEVVVHLYEKQHSKTGLKYFGKTVGKYPVKYPGSGHQWKRHYKKHGENLIETIKVWSFNYLPDATKFALEFSIDNDIVKSKAWANLKEEDALDGGWKNTKGSKGKIWINNGEKTRMIDSTLEIPLGWNRGSLHNNKCKGKIWINDGKQELMIDPINEIPEGWSYGRRPYSDETIRYMSKSQEGRRWINNGVEEISISRSSEMLAGFVLGRRPYSDETRQRMSKSKIGKIVINNGIEQKYVNTNEKIPEGFFMGSLYKTTEGKIVINNGTKQRYIPPTEKIPEGFSVGGIKRTRRKF